MRTHSAVTLMSWLALLAAPPVLAGEQNVLQSVRVEETTGGAQVVVGGSRPPTFTVFRLSGPDRLVVDVASADASAIRGARDGKGPIAGLTISQFADSSASVARVMVMLESARSYDVKPQGNELKISVLGGVSTAPAVASSTVVPAAPKPAAPLAAPAAVASQSAPPAAAAPAAIEAGVAGSTDSSDVVTVARESRTVRAAAQRLTGMKARPSGLSLSFDGEVTGYELLRLTNPSRLALDVRGVKMATAVKKAASAPFSTLRVGAHPDKLRLVVDVEGQADSRVLFAKHGLEWTVGPAKASSPTPAVASGKDLQDGEVEIDGKKVSAASPAPVAASSPAVGELTNLGFVESARGGRVELSLTRPATFQVERPDDRGAVLTLSGVKLPKRLERSLDTSALATPVKMISTFAVPGDGQKIRVVVSADGVLEERVERTAQGLIWHLEAKGLKTEEVSVANRAAPFTSEPAAVASQTATGRTRYVGKKVSFEFKDIDIHNLLRVIAEVTKKNIVVADDVTGKITIRLRNVPWDQALDIILASKGLGKEDVGDIIRVAPLKTLEDEARSARSGRRPCAARKSWWCS